MSRHTWVTQDLYRAGERLMLIAEHDEFLTPRTLPPCIYSTGYTGNPWFINRSDVMDFSTSELIPRTHSMLSIDSGGTATFANDTAIQAIDQAVAWSEAQGRTGPFLLCGTSMGCMDLLAWARTNQNKVAGFLGFTPGTHLSLALAQNRNGLAAAGNAAYGGAYSEEVHGPAHDPIKYAASLAFPVLVLGAEDDTLTLISETFEFAAAVQDGDAINVGATGGHAKPTVDAACRRVEVAEFIKKVMARQ